MKIILQSVLHDFIHKQTKIFSIVDILEYLEETELFTMDDLLLFRTIDFLKKSPLVFQHPGSELRFISRSGYFNNKSFTIHPSSLEIKNGIMIIGHRCVPYINPAVMPHDINFFYRNLKIKKTTICKNITELYDNYLLFGEEYIPHYLVLDTANRLSTSDLTDELPSKINITVLDMKEFYEKWKFTPRDRIVCKVMDWDCGYVKIEPLFAKESDNLSITEDDLKRTKWCHDAENYLLQVFEEDGPCESIDIQLVRMYAKAKKNLFSSYACSIEEMIKRSTKIDFEFYGVETRLWKKGEEIAVSDCNQLQDEPLIETEEQEMILNAFQSFKNSEKTEDSFLESLQPISKQVIDAFVINLLFHKSNDLQSICDVLIPPPVQNDEHYRKAMISYLTKRYNILSKKYNWFIDYKYAKTRSIFIELFTEVLELEFELTDTNFDIKEMPQQSLIMFFQLFSHILKVLEVYVNPSVLTEEEIINIKASIEGLKYSLQDVKTGIKKSMKQQRKRLFCIINPMEDINERRK